jgi:hypothetical protein
MLTAERSKRAASTNLGYLVAAFAALGRIADLPDILPIESRWKLTGFHQAAKLSPIE